MDREKACRPWNSQLKMLICNAVEIMNMDMPTKDNDKESQEGGGETSFRGFHLSFGSGYIIHYVETKSVKRDGAY
ncbi:hypothetical protein C5167_016460 [Papaver somniferum]|nr:hypothetical protein C5167_016460 [Papaver somniferum]